MTLTQKMSREEMIAELRNRDGDHCMLPSCGKPLDFSLVDGPQMVTIDHTFPQAKARLVGWTEAQIWDLTNLTLMHRRCNALKGDREFDEDGRLPIFSDRQKAVDKSNRPTVCDLCESGRLLFFGEVCELCGSGPQPATAPRYLQRTPKECDHSTYFCWMCFIGHVERKSAIDRIITGP